MSLSLTSAQTVGPFFHRALLHDGLETLAGPDVVGSAITLEGRLTDGDGAPVSDAMIEIWQANAAGRYDHPTDGRDQPLDPAFRGFGRTAVDDDGRFRFRTVLPGPVPGRGNSLQAPHIAVLVFARGLLNHLATRIYFAGQPLNETDPVLNSIADPDRRRTLLAATDLATPGVWRFDIRLQGADETVFFAL